MASGGIRGPEERWLFGIVKIFVSCGKDEPGMTVCSKSCDHIQTAHNRHGYIHKGNIGFNIFNKPDSGLSVISFLQCYKGFVFQEN